MILQFGKFGPGADPREISEIPSDYLQWLREEEWFEEKYPEESDELESVMLERDGPDGQEHWHEYEEEGGY